MIDITRFTEWLKLPTRIFVSLCLATGVLLFAADSFLKALGLATFVASYRPYIGAVFVITLALSLVSGFISIARFFHPWIAQAYWIRAGRKRLQSLNPDEKEILTHYIRNQTRSQKLPIQSGVVSALVRDKIIVRASSLGDLHGFDFNIQPWAWEYLNENPELLDLTPELLD